MKTILTYNYKYKKFISDNLQRLIAKKYTEISDEEYDDIQEAINEYLSDEDFSEQEPLAFKAELEELQNEIRSIKPASYEVQQDGLYFVDENGYIVAKIISTGFYAINFDGTNGSNSEPEQIVAALNDLTDVVITDPANGEALVYNSTASKWKNTSVSGSIAGNFTLVDY